MEATCTFSTYKRGLRLLNGVYTCSVKTISGISRDEEITSFIGTHESGKNTVNVYCLHFKEIPLGFVPKNLLKVFPNLKCLSFVNCGFEEISKEDLMGLENIEFIEFSKNKLKSLPDDLFADMKKLRHVYFGSNKLERMSSKILKPVKSTLEFADFIDNYRINERFIINRDVPSVQIGYILEMMMRTIDQLCLPPVPESHKLVSGFSKYKEFTDFSFMVRGKEFKIHKVVFAAQSSVFEKMFSEDGEETSQCFNKIKNFSEGTFAAFLDYFYSGKVYAYVNLVEMFDHAAIFDVPDLKEICEARILDDVDESNAVEVFNLGHRHQSDELKQKSFKIIKKMLPELNVTSINKLDEINRLVALKTETDAILATLNNSLEEGVKKFEVLSKKVPVRQNVRSGS